MSVLAWLAGEIDRVAPAQMGGDLQVAVSPRTYAAALDATQANMRLATNEIPLDLTTDERREWIRERMTVQPGARLVLWVRRGSAVLSPDATVADDQVRVQA